MAKKFTLFLLLMLLTSIGAIADDEPTKYTMTDDSNDTTTDYWLTDQGLLYTTNPNNDAEMVFYGYNKPYVSQYDHGIVYILDDDGNPDPSVPTWDDDLADVEVEILTMVNNMPVTGIYTSALSGKTNIVKVIIPKYITSIEKQAFYNCSGLKEVRSYNPEHPTLGENVFGSLYSNLVEGVTLYVPDGSSDDYKNDNPQYTQHKSDYSSYGSAKGWGDYCVYIATSSSGSTAGLTKGPTFTSVIEMDPEDTGPTIEGYMDVSPTSNERVPGQLESITLSSTDGAITLYDEEAFPILIYSTDDRSEAVASLMYNEDSLDETEGTYTLYVYDADGETQQALTTYGDYTFTIPELAFWIGDESATTGNAPLTLYYTIEDDNQYTIILNPENGFYSSGTLSDISVSCEDGIEQLIGLDINYIYVYKDEDENPFTWIAKDGDVEDTETTINFVFDTSISTPGTYKFTFPEGAFRVGPNNQLSEPIEVTYTISDDVVEEEGEWTFYPAESSTISSLEEIRIQYSTGLEIADGKEDQITLTSTNGDTYTSNDFTIETIYNGILITLNEEITEAGTYTLSAPAGTFLLGQTKKESDDFSISYIVVSYTVTFSPEDGETLEIIDTFTITCEDGLEAVLNDQNEMADLNIISNGEIVALGVADKGNPITDEDENVIGYNFTVEVKVYDEDTETYSYEISPIKDSGTYTIELGRGYFLLGDEKLISDSCSCTYTIEEDESLGINIATEQIQDNIFYNLSGQRVSALKKGDVYIFNGKKILVK